jgi:hypothetical protein
MEKMAAQYALTNTFMERYGGIRAEDINSPEAQQAFEKASKEL